MMPPELWPISVTLPVGDWWASSAAVACTRSRIPAQAKAKAVSSHSGLPTGTSRTGWPLSCSSRATIGA